MLEIVNLLVQSLPDLAGLLLQVDVLLLLHLELVLDLLLLHLSLEVLLDLLHVDVVLFLVLDLVGEGLGLVGVGREGYYQYRQLVLRDEIPDVADVGTARDRDPLVAVLVICRDEALLLHLVHESRVDLVLGLHVLLVNIVFSFQIELVFGQGEVFQHLELIWVLKLGDLEVFGSLLHLLPLLESEEFDDLLLEILF